jgi:hypothetical protein
MTMTNAPAAQTGRLGIWLASLALAAAFVPSIITSIFLGGQARHAFAEPVPGSYVWGTLCAVLLVAPFVASPVAAFWSRKRGMPWAVAVLIGAAAGFAAICAGMFIAMFAAALGGM